MVRSWKDGEEPARKNEKKYLRCTRWGTCKFTLDCMENNTIINNNRRINYFMYSQL